MLSWPHPESRYYIYCPFLGRLGRPGHDKERKARRMGKEREHIMLSNVRPSRNNISFSVVCTRLPLSFHLSEAVPICLTTSQEFPGGQPSSLCPILQIEAGQAYFAVFGHFITIRRQFNINRQTKNTTMHNCLIFHYAKTSAMVVSSALHNISEDPIHPSKVSGISF